MASLKKWTDLSKLLKTAVDSGYSYVPLTEAEIDEFSSTFEIPLGKTRQSYVFEHESGNCSGYYQYFTGKGGWALIAVGPVLSKGIITLRDFNTLNKADTWVTRKDAQRATRSFTAEVGDIVFNKDEHGVIRTAEVLTVDKNGLPKTLSFKGHELGIKDVEGTWQKVAGQEGAARSIYDQGKVTFVNEWQYTTQLANRTVRLLERSVKESERQAREAAKGLPQVTLDDSEFLRGVEEAKKRRMGKKGKE